MKLNTMYQKSTHPNHSANPTQKDNSFRSAVKRFANNGVRKPYKSKMLFMIRRHEVFDILKALLDAPRRVIACGAELIHYFCNWSDWKGNTQRTPWVYKPLHEIEQDLRAYSIRIIRYATFLLAEVGILEKRHNPGNRAERTLQYRIYMDRLKFPDPPSSEPPSSEPPSGEPPSNDPPSSEPPSEGSSAETRMVEHFTPVAHSSGAMEHPSASSDQIYKNQSIEIRSIDLSEESETEQSSEVDPEIWNKVALATELWEQEQYQKEIFRDKEDSGEEEYSATPQNDLKSDEKDYCLRGFESQAERDGFYQALLELGKHKSGVRSTVGWANAIIKGINAGEPCEYLNEYRRGEPVGTCEKQEWEIAPGRPFDNFVSYLKRKMEATQMSPEQAVEKVFKALRDVNEARTLWEGYKRAIANLKDEWDKQQALGVSNAYIPAEMLPDKEVPLSEVAAAMQQLQSNCLPTKTLEPSSTKLLPIEEKSVNESADEPKENAEDGSDRLKAQIERMREYFKSGKPHLVRVAKKWIELNSDIVALVDGDVVSLMPPDP